MGSDTKHSPRGMLNHPGRPAVLRFGGAVLHGPRGGAALLQQGGAVLVQVSKRQRHHARATGVLQRPSVRVSEARLGQIYRRRRADSARLHRRQVGVPHAEDVPPRRPLYRPRTWCTCFCRWRPFAASPCRCTRRCDGPPRRSRWGRSISCRDVCSPRWWSGGGPDGPRGKFVAGGLHDLEFSVTGYAYVFANNAATAAYLACIARYGRTSGLNLFWHDVVQRDDVAPGADDDDAAHRGAAESAPTTGTCTTRTSRAC